MRRHGSNSRDEGDQHAWATWTKRHWSTLVAAYKRRPAEFFPMGGRVSLEGTRLPCAGWAPSGDKPPPVGWTEWAHTKIPVPRPPAHTVGSAAGGGSMLNMHRPGGRVLMMHSMD